MIICFRFVIHYISITIADCFTYLFFSWFRLTSFMTSMIGMIETAIKTAVKYSVNEICSNSNAFLKNGT